MERRQAGGEADESVFFFLNGTERERHAEAAGWKERSEGWRGGCAGSGPSAGEGPETSSQTLVIRLLLM